MKIAVLSTKGGVGKSLISVSLAKKLRSKGYKVALLDLDMSSPCSQYLTKVENNIEVNSKGFTPAHTEEGILLFSVGLLIKKEDSPILLRGAKRSEIIQQLATDIEWGDIAYLIIDCPPTTNEEVLSALKIIRPHRALIICQPDKLSIHAAKRTVTMLRHFKIKIMGIIENMASFKCPQCGAESRLFGDDIKKLCEEVKVDYIESIPFIPDHQNQLPLEGTLLKILK